MKLSVENKKAIRYCLAVGITIFRSSSGFPWVSTAATVSAAPKGTGVRIYTRCKSASVPLYVNTRICNFQKKRGHETCYFDKHRRQYVRLIARYDVHPCCFNEAFRRANSARLKGLLALAYYAA